MNEFTLNWNKQLDYYQAFNTILKSNAIHLVDIRTATPDEDSKQSTDFVISISGGGRVAARVRKTAYRDLTIRTQSFNGGKTEIHKLREGWGRFYLYCWVNEWKSPIIEYILVDIDVLRKSGLLNNAPATKMNTDNRTGFTYYGINTLNLYGALIRHWKQPSELSP